MEHPEQNVSNYIWGFFYFNRNDPRAFLPKFNPDYGIQANFAHPKTYLALLGVFAFFGFVIYMIGTHRVN